MLKRFLVGVAIAVVSFLLGESLAQWRSSADVALSKTKVDVFQQEFHEGDVDSIVTRPPSPKLGPLDVVETQLAALREMRSDATAVRYCFAHASPQNRQKMGPLERFAGMVLTPGYRPLVLQEDVLVGSCTYQGSLATVLVTILDDQRNPAVYRFYLSKQKDGEFKGCWMTDGVHRHSNSPVKNKEREVDPMAYRSSINTLGYDVSFLESLQQA